MKTPAHDPCTAERVGGGLLGVLCGEAWRPRWDDGDLPAGTAAGPVTDALLTLSATYAAGGRGLAARQKAGSRHKSSLPAWLMATAIACPTPARRHNDALKLAKGAGARGRSHDACVTFVELAAALAAGQPAPVAIEAATGSRPGSPQLPAHRLLDVSGDAAIDAFAFGIWVLRHPSCGIGDVVPPAMALAGPPVAAAVGGLVGLRDGVSAIPETWRYHVVSSAIRCQGLLAQLNSLTPARFVLPGQTADLQVVASVATAGTPLGWQEH